MTTDLYRHLSEGTILPLAIFVPFAAGLMLLLIGHQISSMLMRLLAWVGFAIPAAAAACAWLVFILNPPGGLGDKAGFKDSPEYIYFTNFNTGLGYWGISLKLGLNGLSLPLFVMAGTVGLAAGIYAIYTPRDRQAAYLGLLLFMVSGVMGVFASINLFYFYFFHEFALIPTFILIGWWGGPNGRSAALEMTIYLTLGAMLSLIGLIALYQHSGAESFDLISMKAWSPHAATAANGRIFALLLFGFGILVSLWPFHSWAPSGYSAAPAPAAMLHAGVLKKFGLYGLLQIAVPLAPGGMAQWGHLLAWLALGNVFIIGLVTVAQRDLKMMLGYSSVMHMGYIFLGIACLTVLGAGGAVLLMFAHGLSIAALFLLSDAVYARTKTFDLWAMGGLCQKAPVLAAFFVAATLAGIGLPGFANFLGEFSVFVAWWQYSPWMTAVAASGVVISAIYGLRAVSRIFYGQPTANFVPVFDEPLADIRPHERWPLALLLGVSMFVGFWPAAITRGIDKAMPPAFQDPITSAAALQIKNSPPGSVPPRPIHFSP